MVTFSVVITISFYDYLTTWPDLEGTFVCLVMLINYSSKLVSMVCYNDAPVNFDHS